MGPSLSRGAGEGFSPGPCRLTVIFPSEDGGACAIIAAMQAPRSRTLADLAFEQAERYGDAPAVICGDRSVGYRELAERARRVAGGLRRLGIRRGERLGLLVNNRLEWVETFFGAAMLGSVVTAFSTWSKRDELDFLIGDSGVDALILLDRFGA